MDIEKEITTLQEKKWILTAYSDSKIKQLTLMILKKNDKFKEAIITEHDMSDGQSQMTLHSKAQVFALRDMLIEITKEEIN